MRKLTWHVGPPRGCDATLRPRGRAAGGPREGRWRTECGHMAGSHVGPRGRREGRHVAGGLVGEGPTG